MDAAISRLMEKHEIEAICMREKPTLDKAKEFRKMHFRLEMLKQELENSESQQPMAESVLSPK